MINRDEEYNKWCYVSVTGEMGYSDEPVGPYKDHNDMYSLFRENNANNPVYIETLEKISELESKGLVITEYLNEDRYSCSYNVDGPEDLIEEFKTFGNEKIFELTEQWFERYSGDGDNPKVAASVS